MDRIQRRNINIPGGRLELPEQNVVVRPIGEYASAGEIGQTIMGVSSEGLPERGRFGCIAFRWKRVSGAWPPNIFA